MTQTKLTDEQLTTFHEQGFIVLPAVFNDAEIERMRSDADFILELIINASLCHERRSGRLDLCMTDNDQHMVRKIQPVNDLGLAIAQASADDRLLEPMRQIMGDEPILMEEKLNYKQALGLKIEGLGASRASAQFPIHNDWAYYAAQNYPRSILSSAIALDDNTSASGPICVWPGSHKTHLEHESVEIGLEVKDGLIDKEGGQEILAPAGSVMIFSSLVIHNSVQNTSGKPRRMMIYSHYPKAADMGFDTRNGPGRLRESPWELAYLREKLEGRYTDTFKAPASH
ncbi:MAG: phytanoyl-CoA dioxygenase family protein [Kiritimatiellae bacterium]|nr:phytanoyl-CoA dioxygenase family protein [Kiritimatiellia bacterium]